MNLTQRQMVGIGLIIGSLIAAITIQLVTGDLFHVTTTEEPPGGGSILSTQVIIHIVTLTWRYAGSVVACAALGLGCLFIPRRLTRR